jgi:hypothetical protein
VDTNAAFFRELAGRLVSAGAPLDAVLAYELRNEVNWDWKSPPLSATSGSFTAANGQTYDLSSAAERGALAGLDALMAARAVDLAGSNEGC